MAGRLVFFGLLLLLLAAACNRQPAYPPRQPPEGFLQDPANQGAGSTLFQWHCAECHGTIEEGRGLRTSSYVPPPATLTHPKYRTIDPAYLFWRIERGKMVEPYYSRGSVMPAYGPYFSEEQIWQLVAYVHSRGGS